VAEVAAGSGRPESVDALFARARTLLADYQQAGAERVLRRALARIGDGTTPGGLTRGRLLLTLANVRAERGHLSEGLSILDGLAGAGLSGLVSSQRGLMLLRVGRLADALAQMDAAVPALAGMPQELCRVLLNRGYVRMRSGALAGARADFTACADVAGRAGIEDLVVKARFNLGYLDFLSGDLPSALSVLDEALRQEETLPSSGGGTRAVSLLSRARVLFTAGMVAESEADLAEAVAQFAISGARQDQAEAELARSQVALTQRRADVALQAARDARRRFDARGATAWGRLAHLAGLQARLATGRRPGDVASQAQRLIGSLRAAGLDEDARVAAATATVALIAAGRLGEAATAATLLRPVRPGDKILTRVQARTARVALAAALDSPRQALAEVKAGLADLHRYQASFGSLDAQTAVMLHGRELAATGMAMALADGRPALVFEWSERARGLASRLSPVRPPEDAEGAGLLEQLRYVRIELRAAELSGRDDPALRARRSALERAVRQRAWYATGPGDAIAPVGLAQVRAALDGPRGTGTLVSHVVSGGRIHALSVGPAGAQVQALGGVEEVLAALRRVRADLDTLALRNVPEVMAPTLRRSLGRGLDQLDAWLFDGVPDSGGPLVLVPSGPLAAAPWTLLPRLAGRPVTVARSATGWLAARHLARPPAGGPPWVLASGPDLERGEEEVRAVGALYPSIEFLTGRQVSGEAVLRALGHAGGVHIAAHGSHENANPLFSALRLVDGPLFGYDLSRTARMPAQVVLSACDLGLATERPGDDLLGMAAAFLHAGTGSVVASVARLADDVACDVTVAYHRGLRAGRTPAEALAGATDGRRDAPLVCFGSGW
jgi:tetratricopeptide (TPR) repeat protein